MLTSSNTINFERYDLSLRVDQREVPLDIIASPVPPTLTIDISTLVPFNISALALLLVMKLKDAALSHITLAQPFPVLTL